MHQGPWVHQPNYTDFLRIDNPESEVSDERTHQINPHSLLTVVHHAKLINKCTEISSKQTQSVALVAHASAL